MEIEHSIAGYSTYRLISACSISTSVQILQCILIVSLIYILTATSISLIYRVEYRHSKSNKSINTPYTFSFLEQTNSLFGSVAYIIAVRHAQMFHKLRKTFFPFHFLETLEEWRLKKYYLNWSKVNVCGMPIILYGSESLSAQI